MSIALDIDDQTRRFIRDGRVGRLATSTPNGMPSVVPVCYVFEKNFFYSPLDEKPKSVPARQLKRVRNIAANPQVALLIDDYREDWSSLAYVMISGSAQIVEKEDDPSEHSHAVELLREKYSQYRSMALDDRPLLKVTAIRVKRWDARSSIGGN